MKAWVGRALELLRASLAPPCQELNELDWKAALSSDKRRLVEHLSAFANHPGGGFMVFVPCPTGATTRGGSSVACAEMPIDLTVHLVNNSDSGKFSLAKPVQDAALRFATHLVVQTTEHECVFSFYEVLPTIVIGPPPSGQVQAGPEPNAQCVGKIAISLSRAAEFADAISEAVKKAVEK